MSTLVNDYSYLGILSLVPQLKLHGTVREVGKKQNLNWIPDLYYANALNYSNSEVYVIGKN